MIVWENADKVLYKDGWGTRGIWNRYAQVARDNGVITLTTAKDINELEPSCIRHGRIRHHINIEEALAKKAMIDNGENPYL
jgi:hypothetical protein